jgi:acylphosphatase
MSDRRAAYRWLLSGQVQGVGFRWYAARRANELGLKGWVKNLPDGRVEAVAAGNESDLERFDQLLRVGPRSARVTDVEKTQVPHEAVDAKTFEIR